MPKELWEDSRYAQHFLTHLLKQSTVKSFSRDSAWLHLLLQSHPLLPRNGSTGGLKYLSWAGPKQVFLSL